MTWRDDDIIGDFQLLLPNGFSIHLPDLKALSMRLLPFLRWPGGKRWFAEKYPHLIPATFERYIEPFLGAGSVLFYLQPRQAVIADTNLELIETYKGIRSNWARVEKLLAVHQERHSKAHFYKIRSLSPVDPAEKAARMIYLNRTCFNGIYRVNFDGKFNVPKGTRSSVVFETDNYRAVAMLLRRASLFHADFQEIVDSSKPGDLIFADPPYTVRHNLNAFVRYNEKLFSWADQVRLANTLLRARERGSRIVSTNANHESVRSLYEQRGFDVKIINRFSPISAQSHNRKNFEELVVIG